MYTYTYLYIYIYISFCLYRLTLQYKLFYIYTIHVCVCVCVCVRACVCVCVVCLQRRFETRGLAYGAFLPTISNQPFILLRVPLLLPSPPPSLLSVHTV